MSTHKYVNAVLHTVVCDTDASAMVYCSACFAVSSTMDDLSVSKYVIFIVLLSGLTVSTAAEHEGFQPIPVAPEAFPVFSTEPMSRDQCALQYSENCNPTFLADPDQIICASTALEMTCSTKADSTELLQVATSLSKPPLRALLLRLYDGEQIDPAHFAAVRKQIIGIDIFNCTTPRTTAKLPELRFVNVLEFQLHNCYDLEIYRGDFSQSSKTRVIKFYNTTIRTLERDTFTDLPALRQISLEAELDMMDVFSKHLRDYLKRLHCGCEYEWYRRWWSSNALLLREAGEGEIYKLTQSWSNANLSRKTTYLPIDCAVQPFPNGSSAVDFTQRRFSINEEAFNDSEHEKASCQERNGNEPFPDFSPEVINQEECALQFTKHCGNRRKGSLNTTVTADICSKFAFQSVQWLEIEWDGDVESTEISSLTTAMARFAIRPLYLELDSIFSVTHENLLPVIKQILTFFLFGGCSSSRSAGQLKQLRLVNLLHYSVWNCYDQEIRKDDFQHSRKLRIITFHNATIKTLEAETFSDLPDLRLLSLELGAGYLDTPHAEFDNNEKLREFYFRLHCGCELAWFRKWWIGNQRLLRMAEKDEVISGPVVHKSYTRKDIHVPLDCATNTTALKLDSMKFSFNDSC